MLDFRLKYKWRDTPQSQSTPLPSFIVTYAYTYSKINMEMHRKNNNDRKQPTEGIPESRLARRHSLRNAMAASIYRSSWWPFYLLLCTVLLIVCCKYAWCHETLLLCVINLHDDLLKCNDILFAKRYIIRTCMLFCRKSTVRCPSKRCYPNLFPILLIYIILCCLTCCLVVTSSCQYHQNAVLFATQPFMLSFVLSF